MLERRLWNAVIRQVVKCLGLEAGAGDWMPGIWKSFYGMDGGLRGDAVLKRLADVDEEMSMDSSLISRLWTQVWR
jgi:hypothetical protein